jgi:putative DNA primase/helicase
LDPVDLGREVLTAAVELAANGTRVFPVWGLRTTVGPDGPELRCACGAAACANPGKHPVGGLVPHGHNDASTDHATVAGWFQVPDLRPGGALNGWSPRNLGVATGRGLVVIDAEAKSNRPDLPTGLEVLDDWETWTQGTSLPQTHVVRTGSGGLHLWLAVDPNLRVKSRNRILPNVDVKADGGYVLAAPSAHISGGRYEIVGGLVPARVDAELLGWLLTVKGGRYISRKASDGSPVVPDDYDFRRIVAGTGCPAGHRDYFVNDLCFRLRRSGASLDDAAAALRREWLRMENPPGDEFPWESCVYKLRRVWDEVTAEEITDLPAWRPPGTASGSTGTSDTGVDLDEPGSLHGSTVELLERPDLTFHGTDTGNGIRFAQRMRDVVRYCTGEGRWYLWEDGRWKQDDLNRALLLTEEVVRDIYVEASRLPADERNQLENWAKTSQSVGKREAMLAVAAAQPGIAIRPDDLDSDPWLLVVRNGTLDLRTGQVRASEPADLFTRRAEVFYDPDARCPLWHKHMEFVTGGDALLQDYLRRAAGYTLTGLTGEQKIFFLWGNGANGKSTFVDVLAALLGDYATQADENLLTGTGGHPTQLADLRGTRLVVSDETDRDKKLAEQRIKMMTGKVIKARYMRQDFFRYTPRFKLWVSGNHKPEIRGNDYGIWRRLKLVPFEAKFTDDQRILDYEDVLRGELAGILNWALEGLAAWREVGQLGETETVARATAEYRDEEDSIGLWLAEAAEFGVEARTEFGRLYESYRWWCAANGIQDVRSSTALGRDLTARGLRKDVVKMDGRSCRIWHGVRLNGAEA